MSSGRIEESVRERMEKMAKMLRLPLPEAPEQDILPFPADLSSAGEEVLGHLLTQYTALQAYGRAQAAIIDGIATIAELEAAELYSLRYSQATGQVTDKKHEVSAKPTVRNKHRKAAEMRGDAKFLGSLVHGYESMYNAVSREISRRAAGH